MRTAFFALTDGGARLLMRLADTSDGGTIHLPERLRGSVPSAYDVVYFTRLADIIHTAFMRYDALICVMATGIVVRMIAPYATSKLYDPAVLVFDEAGRHGISLLSGHIGGANDLTRKLCTAVGAAPVITTATDVTGVVAPDVLAAKLALRPLPKPAIQTLNAALLGGKEITYLIDTELPQAAFYEAQLCAEEIQAKLFRGDIPPVGEDEYRVILSRAEHISDRIAPRTVSCTASFDRGNRMPCGGVRGKDPPCTDGGVRDDRTGAVCHRPICEYDGQARRGGPARGGRDARAGDPLLSE